MAISEEQSKQIKKQLLIQIEQINPENKEQIIKYIESMNEEELEEFLKKNQQASASPAKASECVFCSIVKNEIPSYKIGEDKNSISILEINPLSKGHSIVIPIEHATIDKIPKSALTLSQKIAKKIKKKLKPDDIKIETSSFQGHSMINIIPIYKDIMLKKQKAEEEELKALQRKLMTVKRTSKKKEKKIEMPKNFPIFKMRIPR
jgi:histidine triad (HIT) family protein